MTDRPHFDDRFEVLGGLAYRVAYRLLGDREEAREVAQETLARAFARWRKVSRYDEPWVVRVATNQALDRHRRWRPTVPIDDRHRAPVPDPAHVALQRHGLVECLRRLPRRQREVVVLRYFAHLTDRQIADALGVAEGTVKSRLSRAHRQLASDEHLSSLRDGTTR